MLSEFEDRKDQDISLCPVRLDPKLVEMNKAFNTCHQDTTVKDADKIKIFYHYLGYEVAIIAEEFHKLSISNDQLRFQMAKSVLERGVAFLAPNIGNFDLSQEQYFQLACLAAEKKVSGICIFMEKFGEFLPQQYKQILEIMLINDPDNFNNNSTYFFMHSRLDYQENLPLMAAYNYPPYAEKLSVEGESFQEKQQRLRSLFDKALQKSCIGNAKKIACAIHEIDDDQLTELAFEEEYQRCKGKISSGLSRSIELAINERLELSDNIYRSLAKYSAETAEFALKLIQKYTHSSGMSSILKHLDVLVDDKSVLPQESKQVIAALLESGIDLFSKSDLRELIQAEKNKVLNSAAPGCDPIIESWKKTLDKIISGESLSIEERKSDIYRSLAYSLYRPYFLSESRMSETMAYLSTELPEKGEDFIFSNRLIPIGEDQDSLIAHNSKEVHAFFAVSAASGLRSLDYDTWFKSGMQQIVVTHPKSKTVLASIRLTGEKEADNVSYYKLDISVNHKKLVELGAENTCSEILNLLSEVSRDNNKVIIFSTEAGELSNSELFSNLFYKLASENTYDGLRGVSGELS